MDHSEAIRQHASEKYLLGELSAELREQFEEHFFACPECAHDLRQGAMLLDNARRVLTDEATGVNTVVVSPRPTRPWFARWQPAPSLAGAIIVLLGIFAYQNLVTIPALKSALARPEALTSFSLLAAGSRGPGPMVIQAPKNQPFGLYVDIPATGSFSYYTVVVETESGARPVHVRVTAEQAQDTVQILVPAGVLKPGKESLVIEGYRDSNSPAKEIARYPFLIQVP